MAGRPPINDPEDVEAIQNKIDSYFASCGDGEGQKPPGFAGLAYALGYSSRQSLWETAKKGHPISLPIKMALLYIESEYEARLHSNSPTGAIFALKNRGWTDKQEIEHSGELPAINIKVVKADE